MFPIPIPWVLDNGRDLVFGREDLHVTFSPRAARRGSPPVDLGAVTWCASVRWGVAVWVDVDQVVVNHLESWSLSQTRNLRHHWTGEMRN